MLQTVAFCTEDGRSAAMAFVLVQYYRYPTCFSYLQCNNLKMTAGLFLNTHLFISCQTNVGGSEANEMFNLGPSKVYWLCRSQCL